jgi:DNA-binding transcriptional regulator/RsmH inhibitor MraZ
MEAARSGETENDFPESGVSPCDRPVLRASLEKSGVEGKSRAFVAWLVRGVDMAGRQQHRKKKNKRKRSGDSAGMPLFVGRFDGTVGTDGRLWIRLKMRKQLEKHNVDTFWVALHPAKAVILLCPAEFWRACERKVERWGKKEKGASSAAGELLPLDEVKLESRGRITLHKLAMQHLKIGGDPRDVVISARGHWFEVERKVEIQRSEEEGENDSPSESR